MASWDRYLTARDKKHDRRWGKKDPNGFGSRPALLLIDIYYSVLGTKREPIFRSMRTWRDSTGLEGWAAVDRTADLLVTARTNLVPIIHITGGLDANIRPWFRGARESGSGQDPELVRKGREIVSEVAPIDGEVVIEKSSPSAFWGTPLQFHLNALGIDTLIVCGETTSGCVRATVVDGATNRYHMGVVEDCVFDRTEASHFISLYDMHQKYADVVSLEFAKEYFVNCSEVSTPEGMPSTSIVPDPAHHWSCQ